ncbi:MAG: hypothetical protein JRG86_12300 [Deltaproteobacteria bacterium]|nr:hypothetical protein [Deltaproteobacteria bacterium]MBW2497400.1 hypothetical protein [Deltaproteobacteria bacterium]
MDLYHIWCDLERGVSDLGFCEEVERYLGALRDAGRIEAFRISRRKLGLGPQELGEFHIVIEIVDLAQLDSAFRDVSQRSGPIDLLHGAVQRSVRNVRFALYRDFPDAWRRARGETS